jgi:hypothetical protein
MCVCDLPTGGVRNQDGGKHATVICGRYLTRDALKIRMHAQACGAETHMCEYVRKDNTIQYKKKKEVKKGIGGGRQM